MENKCIIGLGYVKPFLMVEMLKHYEVVGLDLDDERIKALRSGNDYTNEVDDSILQELLSQGKLEISNKKDILEQVNFFIVTVPTLVDDSNVPNLNPLKSAITTIAEYLKKGDIVVIEFQFFRQFKNFVAQFWKKLVA